MTEPDAALEIQQEIEQTRERLGQTVEELAAKADLKARAREKADEVKARAAEVSGRVKQSQAVRRDWPLALVAAGILATGAALAWRRRET